MADRDKTRFTTHLPDVSWEEQGPKAIHEGVTKKEPQRDYLQDLADKIAAVRDYRNEIIGEITGLQKRADTLHRLLNDIDNTIEGFEEALRQVREDY